MEKKGIDINKKNLKILVSNFEIYKSTNLKNFKIFKFAKLYLIKICAFFDNNFEFQNLLIL